MSSDMRLIHILEEIEGEMADDISPRAKRVNRLVSDALTLLGQGKDEFAQNEAMITQAARELGMLIEDANIQPREPVSWFAISLKSCPFCGGEAKIAVNDAEGNLRDEEYEEDPWSGLSFTLTHAHEENDGCPIARYEADGSGVGVYLYDSREEAAEAWNARKFELPSEYEQLREELKRYLTPKSIDDWHEDYGDVLWWTLPVEEPPYRGSPLSDDWPGYHTHWTTLPVVGSYAE